MKIKTSITLSEGLLKEIDEILETPGSRSIFIEKAIKDYIERNKRKTRDCSDLELINNYAADLNIEAEDVLSYQVES
ncbi:MAG: hypothetical protein KAT34_06425 [Candidatus Aminicenantes bacterium]|nr:hypothetical protein [Candidatus Aminicenantes bacterium]